MLREGRIIQAGSPRELYATPADASLAEFLGEANILPTRIEGACAHTAIGTLDLTGAVAAEGAEAVLIRLEDLGLEICENRGARLRRARRRDRLLRPRCPDHDRVRGLGPSAGGSHGGHRGAVRGLASANGTSEQCPSPGPIARRRTAQGQSRISIRHGTLIRTAFRGPKPTRPIRVRSRARPARPNDHTARGGPGGGVRGRDGTPRGTVKARSRGGGESGRNDERRTPAAHSS